MYQGASELQKDFFKLMNKSIFDKTMENPRKRIRVDLVLAMNICQSHQIFNGDFVAIHSIKSQLKLIRPVYVRQAVLDLSKVQMYDFWYNEIKKQ